MMTMINVKLLFSEFETHDTKRFLFEKPDGYEFTPGQATEVHLSQEEWEDEGRPFTFTSSQTDLLLEFFIKKYPEHDAVTKRLHELKPGDSINLSAVWGTITYHGPGTFLAAGAGVTPFIAILRDLKRKGTLEGNSLIFSNKCHADIILEREFRHMFTDDPSSLVLTLTREKRAGYEHGRIDRRFLQSRMEDFGKRFYICGPPSFVEDTTENLAKLGVDSSSLVLEE
jgi:ferredoxin-NADP reductase